MINQSAAMPANAFVRADLNAAASGSVTGAKRFRLGLGKHVHAPIRGRTPADKVDRLIVREPQQIGPGLARAFDQTGIGRQFTEHIMKDIPRLLLIAQEIQQQTVQRSSMFVIDRFQLPPFIHLFGN